MKISIAFLLCLFSFFCNAQNRKECKSSAKAKYEDSLKNKWKTYSFNPISKADAIKPVFSYVEIHDLDQPSQSKDFVDSLDIKVKQVMASLKIKTDDFEKEFNIRDSLNEIEARKRIGNISRPQVIKSERKGKKWAILYLDYKYDEMLAFGAGYWISLSEDDGKTWKKYYTGLTGGKNYYFKRNSKPSLWQDDNHLQIEADIMRMTEPRAHPIPPQYEVVKDNALIVLNLAEIVKDSDGDGLTDIEEKNLFLNPFSNDTDGDGISDLDDNNPRFASSSNDFVKLYEGLMFGENVKSDGKYPEEIMMINLLHPVQTNTNSNHKIDEDPFSDEIENLNTVKLLVTDDKNLQSINPKNSRIIILTPKEYKEYQKQYHSELEKLNYSPLFKCDNDSNVFLMKYSASYAGETYKIERTKTGWKIITISSWIS